MRKVVIYNARIPIMEKNVFISFHYDGDSSRVQRFRDIVNRGGAGKICPNDWEGGKEDTYTIRKWINSQLEKADCTIVLIGSHTATSEWVKYEITRSWELGLGLIGINVHNLKDKAGATGIKGAEPFTRAIGEAGKLVPIYELKSTDPYQEIATNINQWLQLASNKAKNNY